MIGVEAENALPVQFVHMRVPKKWDRRLRKCLASASLFDVLTNPSWVYVSFPSGNPVSRIQCILEAHYQIDKANIVIFLTRQFDQGIGVFLT